MAIDRNQRELAKTLFLVNAILGTICTFGIAAIWLWPMYSFYNKATKDNEQHIALAICSILFTGILGIISAILLLISGSSSTSTKGNK